MLKIVRFSLEVGTKYVRVEDIEEQDRVVGNQGTTRFTHDRGVLDSRLLADSHDLFDHIVAILFHRVVSAVAGVRAASIVVNRKTSSDIKQAHRSSLFHQSCIETCSFCSTDSDIVNIGNL